MNFTMKFSYTPISHILVISNVWFGTDAQTIFPPMGAQITSIVFPPMRSELTKLNKSTYPQSRILSPFVFMTMFLQIVAMDHFVQIIVPKFVFVQIVIPDNHFWQIVVLDSILANCCSKHFFCTFRCEKFFADFANSFPCFLFLQIVVVHNLSTNF